MEAAEGTTTEPIRIESYGVRIDIRIDPPDLAAKVLPLLPPGWESAPDSFPDAEFALLADGSGHYLFSGGESGHTGAQRVDLDVALTFLELRVRSCVARWAPERIFVHAGAVARDGRALIIPGESFSGKSTLVAALVRAGATYLSDEFAVLDDDGFVHPYAKPLWLRSSEGKRIEEATAEALGGAAADVRAPVSLVAVTSYVPGGRWDPSPVSSGEAALALMANTVPAQERPAEALRVVRRVAQRCRCVQGDRGEAETAASALLELLESS
jgi:hypothetical protein